MSWMPTKGQKLADEIVQRLCGAAPGVGATTTPLFAWHMMDVIAKALDQAIADGAEHGAMEKVTTTQQPDWAIGLDALHSSSNGNGHANPDDYSELPVMAKGWEASSDEKNWVPVPLDDHMPDASPMGLAELKQEGALYVAPWADPALVNAPKKRRGRPPGSKAKAAKPAKKRKSAKAIRAELYPVEAPVAETVAATVTEAPAEAHADSP